MNTLTAKDGIILWEAHRAGGGGVERPESCMISFEYGWALGGRPEADINLTKDGVMLSVHDPELSRIARYIPEDLRGKQLADITYADVCRCEFGDDRFPGQKVTRIDELLKKLQEDSTKNIIIDYKRVDLKLLAQLISQFGVARQITFASCEVEKGREIKALLPEIRIKQWIGDSPEEQKQTFNLALQNNFNGFEEVQLHLNDLPDGAPHKHWRYQLQPEDLKDMLAITQEHGVLLQVLPWRFTDWDLETLLDMGIRSFAVDFPSRFKAVTDAWFMRQNH